MQIISLQGTGGAAKLGSTHVRPPKENALCLLGTGQGIYQQTQAERGDDSPFGTQTANEILIFQLRAAMVSAAAADDLATYQWHYAEYLKALSARSPEQVHRLNAQHLAAVERAAELGDHGLCSGLETGASRAVAWRTSRPVADEVNVRGAA